MTEVTGLVEPIYQKSPITPWRHSSGYQQSVSVQQENVASGGWRHGATVAETIAETVSATVATQSNNSYRQTIERRLRMCSQHTNKISTTSKDADRLPHQIQRYSYNKVMNKQPAIP